MSSQYDVEIMDSLIRMSHNAICKKRKVVAWIKLPSFHRNFISFTDYEFGYELGFNRPPHGIKSCEKCSRMDVKTSDYTNCRTLHAEIEAIYKALMRFEPYSENPLESSTMYVTTFPCHACAMSIIYHKIKIVYYREEYYREAQSAVENLFKMANVYFEKI